jgi:hypothetical protein
MLESWLNTLSANIERQISKRVLIDTARRDWIENDEKAGYDSGTDTIQAEPNIYFSNQQKINGIFLLWHGRMSLAN